jgi:DNA-binding CsgD family transcriptional regulator
MGQILMLGHRFGEAAGVTEGALTLARAAGSPPEIIAHMLSTLGVVHAYTGDVPKGIRLAEESVRVASQIPPTEDLHRAYTNLSCVLMLDDLQRAAQVALEGTEIANRDGLATTHGKFLLGNAAASLMALGDWERTDALLADAVTDVATDAVSTDNLLVTSVVLAAWRGDQASVDRDLAQIDAALSRGGLADMRSRLAVAAAEAATWCRAYAAAAGYVMTAADADADTDDLDMRPQVAAVGLRLAADWPVTESRRQALTRRMLALASDPRCRKPPGRQGRAYLRTAEAEASRLAGPGDPGLWQAAVEAWELVPAPHRAGYARLRLAEALLRQPGQRKQAQAELGAVRAVAVRLNARALAEEAEQLALRTRLGSATADPPDPGDCFGLTQRERDVLELVRAGCTNRQIAAHLFISPKTAGLHVSHILAKLCVTTRGEAAAIAHRLGLGDPTVSGRRSEADRLEG